MMDLKIESDQAEKDEIISGLTKIIPEISPKYFYDSTGSQLFEEITQLAEYYPTRSEKAIFAQHGEDIAAQIGAGCALIEPGAGSCEKAKKLCELIRPSQFLAIDISRDFLQESAEMLRRHFSSFPIDILVADLGSPIQIPIEFPREKRLVFYPGSSLGNFHPEQATELLSRFRELLDVDGALLIGVDLQKERAILEAAYDDKAGITAEFNLNILSHINHLISSDFDLSDWKHVAFFNAAESRIEMHLQTVRDCLVRWPGGERFFSEGMRIHTENSYKYTRESLLDLLKNAGFSNTQIWLDDNQWFAVVLARPDLAMRGTHK